MIMESEKFTLLNIFLIITFIVFHVNAQTTCLTARRRELGICVPISACKVITAAQQRFPKFILDAYIQESLCGGFNEARHVCCVRKYVTYEAPRRVGPQTPIISEPNPEPDSSKIHPGTEKSDEAIQLGLNILHNTRCGYQSPDRVANGEDAGLQEFPWMALLLYNDGVQTTMDCGGSLITTRHVLTAAHCLRHSIPLVKVRLGEYDTTSNPDCLGTPKKRKCAPPMQEIDVEEAIYHQDYSHKEFSNDIGLIRLAREATINTAVKPICLPITENAQKAIVPKMQISGWGQLETGIKASVLQKALVVMKSNNICRDVHKLINITDNHLCAGGNENIVTCMGDSGGPLFASVRYRDGARYVQYGVVSSGSLTCGTFYPDVFAKVRSHLSWIAGHLS